MYSLRQDARPVRRVKTRCSERSCSRPSSFKVLLTRASWPGKKREKAMRQAWGVVTRL
jgi:hypothetical protein